MGGIAEAVGAEKQYGAIADVAASRSAWRRFINPFRYCPFRYCPGMHWCYVLAILLSMSVGRANPVVFLSNALRKIHS